MLHSLVDQFVAEAQSVPSVRPIQTFRVGDGWYVGRGYVILVDGSLWRATLGIDGLVKWFKSSPAQLGSEAAGWKEGSDTALQRVLAAAAVGPLDSSFEVLSRAESLGRS